MSRGRPFRILGIAILVIELILILNNISKLTYYKTAEAEVTNKESHMVAPAHSGSHKESNYIRYTVNGEEYTACIHGHIDAEVGGTISVRYKPSNPIVLLPIHYTPVDDMNGVGIVLGLMVIGTGFLMDKKEDSASTGLFGIG